MADIELVIKIPEKYIKTVQHRNPLSLSAISEVEKAIAVGIPLPKGHGRLIDADELKKIIQENDVLTMTGFNVRLCDINSTPTIIEADKESEDKE